MKFFLPRAGKEVWIKALAQAITLPQWVSSNYLLLCVKILAEQGKSESRHELDEVRKIMWAKVKGGLEFRDLETFNLALLAKQCWRLLTMENTLVFKTLKAKYFHRGTFMTATIKSNASYTWQSIPGARYGKIAGFQLNQPIRLHPLGCTIHLIWKLVSWLIKRENGETEACCRARSWSMKLKWFMVSL